MTLIKIFSVICCLFGIFSASVEGQLLRSQSVDGTLHQRDSENEKKCHDFLTEEASSPMIPSLKRDLESDAKGELFCRLTLKVRFIRIISIEGREFYIANK